MSGLKGPFLATSIENTEQAVTFTVDTGCAVSHSLVRCLDRYPFRVHCFESGARLAFFCGLGLCLDALLLHLKLTYSVLVHSFHLRKRQVLKESQMVFGLVLVFIHGITNT